MVRESAFSLPSCRSLYEQVSIVVGLDCPLLVVARLYWLSSLIAALVLSDLTLILLIAIIVSLLSQFMMIFLVLVPDSSNVFAAVPTAIAKGLGLEDG